MRHLFIAGFACLITSGMPAYGHAGFLIPVADESDTTGEVILQATFSGTFPQTEIGLTSDNWTIITPSGDETDFMRFVERPTHTILQTILQRPGTYRLSTGERLGRKGQATRIDGKLMRVGPDGLAKADVPHGTKLLTSQTATVSDIYISRGAVSESLSGHMIGRLEISPLNHPNQLSLNQPFSAKILFEGKPMADCDITVFSPGSGREKGSTDTTLRTDTIGEVSFTPEVAGSYLIMVRHLADAPAGSQTEVRSYTTTLTLLVP